MRKRGCWLSCVCGRGGEKKRREEGGEGEEEEKRKKRGLNSPRNVCEKKKRGVCVFVGGKTLKHIALFPFFLHTQNNSSLGEIPRTPTPSVEEREREECVEEWVWV